MEPKDFLAQVDHPRIVKAIRDAEARSRGEIRVHVASHAVDDVLAEAQRRFVKLGMTATAERNGVLVYLAPRAQRFAILGDRAIHERCGDDFWRSAADAMQAELRAGRYTDAVVAAVARIADVLAQHFPRRAGDTDRNELSDEVSED